MERGLVGHDLFALTAARLLLFRVNTFYWGGCIDFANTHIYTASAVEGPWQRHATINKCYYDPGLLIDDNDTMYVAYGNTNISVAQLSPDGRTEVRSQQVFTTPPNIGTLEGARFYKRNESYYIFLTRPANGQYILKASNPFGPYTLQQVLLDMPGPIAGGGVPHQGGLVPTSAAAGSGCARVPTSALAQAGSLLLQHRRQRRLHPPRPRVHHEQRLAVLHGLPTP